MENCQVNKGDAEIFAQKNGKNTTVGSISKVLRNVECEYISHLNFRF